MKYRVLKDNFLWKKDACCVEEEIVRRRCTLEFWTVLNEVLYLAYVDYEEK